MASDDKRIRHLDFIQLTITRMAANSFLLKAWVVTLAAGLFALATADTNRSYSLIAFLPVGAFWILDGYYLHQERLYRGLYDKVRQTDEADIDFSLHTNGISAPSWLRSIFSTTLSIFYGIVLAMVIVVTIVLGRK